MEEEVLNQQQTAPVTPEEMPQGATTPEAMPTEEQTPSAPPTPSARDAFRSEYSGNYPDEDLTDDEAYVNHLRGKLKERDDYEGMVNNITSSMGNSRVMTDMLNEASKEHTDEDGNPVPFDPILWAIETGQLDWEALGSDPEYAKKVAEAQAKARSVEARRKELEDMAAQNLPESIESVNATAEELGHSQEQKEEVIALAYQIMNDLVLDKLTPETYRVLANGIAHDDDVENSRQLGRTEANAKRVTDKLRTLPDRPSRAGGRQTPSKARTEETEDEANMFGL